MRRSAFTLIELLVVMAIIAIFAGMLFASGVFTRDRAELRVAEAARGVERILLEARNLAITTGKTHGVVFHIANAGDGRVLRNGDPSDSRGFEGRHWCAIVGPALESDEIPHLKNGFFVGRFVRYGSAQRLAATIEGAQIGERYHLPRGARFLALGDAEDNLHTTLGASLPRTSTAYEIDDWSVDTPTRTGTASLNPTYPRPWFGLLTGAGTTWTLHPWGGYDPAILGSGLDYECSHRAGSTTRYPVTMSRNDQPCICGVDSNRTAKTPAQNPAREGMYPCGDASQIGADRPLINGPWMDFTIVFLPNGTSRTLLFYSRTALFSYRSDTTSAGARTFPFDRTEDGVPSNDSFRGRDDAIIVLESGPIGGTAITVAKDPRSSQVDFPGPEEALKHIRPLRRIIVNNATGGVTVSEPYATIQRWLDTQERDLDPADRVWINGYEFCPADDPDPRKIRVTNALTAEMLTQHDPYPWIKPKP